MKEHFKDIFRQWRAKNKSPEAQVTRAYMLALIIIGFLTVEAHNITKNITEAQQETADITYNLSRQRSYIQQSIQYSERYFESGSQIDKDFLNQSISQLETSYQFLVEAIEGEGTGEIASPILHKTLFEGPYLIDSKMRKFISTVKAVSDPPDSLEKRDIRDLIRLMDERTSGQLINGFDVAIEFYQKEAAEVMDQFYHYQSFTLLFIITILFIEAIFIFRPLVKKLADYHRKLLKMALEDPLTGLSNRRAFINNSTAEIANMARQRQPYAIALCDLDKFKSINDTYGHNVGDLVLKHFSKILVGSLREEDIVGRIGGEEFAIMLPNTDEKEAFMVIDRLRENTEVTPCGYSDDNNRKQTLSYTGSFGIVVSYKMNENIESLLSMADKKLYEAKEGGRNRALVDVLKPPVRKKRLKKRRPPQPGESHGEKNQQPTGESNGKKRPAVKKPGSGPQQQNANQPPRKRPQPKRENPGQDLRQEKARDLPEAD